MLGGGSLSRSRSSALAAARLVIPMLLAVACYVASAAPASAARAQPAASRAPHLAHPPSALGHAARGRVAQPAITSASPAGYIPCDVWNAYHLPSDPAQQPTGTGQLIAIIDPYDKINAAADLQRFDSAFGIPDPPGGLRVYPSAIPAGWTFNVSSPPWSLEIALDIEWAHAMAPGAAIALVYSQTANDLDSSFGTGLLTAVDYAVNTLNADLVSMSWTIGEVTPGNPGGLTAADVTSDDVHFPPTNGAGRSVTYLAATGDAPAGPPSWPADSGRVIGVGGTTVTPAGFGYPFNPVSHTSCPSPPAVPPGVVGRETPWSGSQSGLSGVVPRPPYQQPPATPNNRQMPDVAMLGDPNDGVAVYLDGGWDSVPEGGTSLSTALWAGVVARLDQARRGAGLPGLRVTPLSSWPYDLPPSDFNARGPSTGNGSPLYQYLSNDVTKPSDYTAYFSWYDNASPGMSNDNIHLVNPSTAANRTVSVDIPGCSSVTYSGSTNLGPGGEVYAKCASPIASGPVTVTAIGGRVIASQRVQFNDSFNEAPAMARTDADFTLYFSWYDSISDAGFAADEIHVFNPSNIDGHVTVRIPGCPTTGPVSLAHGEDKVFTCTGYGGPVVVTADVPVLGSQRVQFYSTFSEVNGMQSGSSTVAGYFTWYDELSSPGFLPPGGANIHVINPTGSDIHVVVNVPKCGDQAWTIAPGQYHYFNCAGAIGGPVKVTSSDGRFLASARTRYYQSFNEVEAMSLGQSGASLYAAWFDRVSSSGFLNDNLHVINLGPAPATITASIPHCGTLATQPALTPPGQEAILTCASGFGGPVLVNSDQPILASQRVQYFQTFNEAAGSP
jgi:hypothetical protein